MGSSVHEDSNRLCWCACVPIDLNPYIMKDLAVAILAIASGIFLISLGWQWLLPAGRGEMAAADLNASLVTALSRSVYSAFGLVGIFLLVSKILFGNRYIVEYGCSDHFLKMNMIRVRHRAGLPRIDRKPSPAELLPGMQRLMSKNVALCDIARVEPHEVFRMLELHGKTRRLARIYCPDEKTYGEVLSFLIESAGSAPSHA